MRAGTCLFVLPSSALLSLALVPVALLSATALGQAEPPPAGEVEGPVAPDDGDLGDDDLDGQQVPLEEAGSEDALKPGPASLSPRAPVTGADGDVLASPPPASIPAAPRAALAQNPRGDRKPRCPDRRLVCWENDTVAIWPRVRVRPGFEYVEADPQILYVGHNDGFFLHAARIGAEGNVSDLVRFHITLDAASLVQGGGPNQPVNPILAAARDAWVAWTPSRWFVLQAGQQPMPSDFEGGFQGTDVDAIIPFTRRSLASGGVRPGHGLAVDGLSPDRQIGVVIGSGNGAGFGNIPLEYRLGIANGNGLNLLGNDNKLPAAYLRLGTGYGDIVRVGVGGRLNPRTVGTLPNLYTETDAVGFADVSVGVAGLELVLEAMYRHTSLATLIPDPSDPAGQETGFGATSWLAYRIDLGSVFGAPVAAKPAVRLSFYDPSSAFRTDQLMETTIGLRIDGDPRIMPLSFFIDYAILTEVGELGDDLATRDLANNRLTALFQLEL